MADPLIDNLNPQISK